METENAVVESPQETVTDSIEEASTNDLREALGVTEEVSQEVSPEQAAEPEPEPEGQQPEVEGESEAERLAKRRIRPRTELDQQVIDLYRSEAFNGTFADASRIIYNQQEQAAPNNLPPQEAEAPKPDPYDGQVSELQGQITELEEKVAKAAEELETTEALRLQREIMRKELEMQSLTTRREREEEAKQQYAYNTHQEKTVESRDRVYERFPELQDKNHIARKQFDEYVRVAHSDPDYASVFESPKWPELLANEFASQFAPQQPTQQVETPQVPQQQAPQMGTQAKVLTTGTAAQPANSPLTTNGVTAELPNLSSEDLYKLLGSAGGAQPLR
tara:strand:- start:986 stop:1981 length:996 start_codon:yes stop_codon:yes gene_type:complete